MRLLKKSARLDYALITFKITNLNGLRPKLPIFAILSEYRL